MDAAGGDSEVEGPGLPWHTGHQLDRGDNRSLELAHPDDKSEAGGVHSAVSDRRIVDAFDLEAFAAEER